MKKIVLAYIPVLHQGYLKFLREAVDEGADELILIAGNLAKNWVPAHKDIHALSENEIKEIVGVLVPKLRVKIIEKMEDLKPRQKFMLICPDEIVTREVVAKAEELDLIDQTVQIEWKQVFLRWDKQKAVAESEPGQDEVISEDEFDQKMIQLASAEGGKSADWWRQVGAVLSRDGKILLQSHNNHLPHEQQPNVEGDIRGQFHKGDHWELGTAIHAEADVIARAAKEGLKTEGAEMYVSDFPCPNCAKLIARAGIKRVFYQKGYAVSDGERVLKAAGITLIRVIS